MGNAAKTTCLLIGGAGNLDRATIIGTAGDKGLGGDDGAGKPALHIAGTAAIDPVTLDGGGERVSGPPLADRDNIGMGVEMHAFTAAATTGTFMPADDIPARISVRITKRALGPHKFGAEPAAGKAGRKVITDLAVILAWRVDGRKPDQATRRLDQRLAALVDLGPQTVS